MNKDYPTFVGDEVEQFDPSKPFYDQVFVHVHVIDDEKCEMFVQDVYKWAKRIENKCRKLQVFRVIVWIFLQDLIEFY